MRTIAARLLAARKHTGLSQRGLAKLAGLSERHVGLIEDGARDNPELNTLQKLAKVLGTTIGWLSSGEGKEPKPEEVRAAVAAAEAAKGAA